MSTGDAGTGDSAAAQKTGLGDLVVGEQLMGVGALLILVLADLIGDVFVDEYSISYTIWILALGVLAAIYFHRIAGKSMPIPFRWTMMVLGYSGAALGIREIIDAIDGDYLFEGGSMPYQLALYVGAALLAIGAYRLSQDN
ncbi:MAG: hypothetical protein V3R84_02035 [Acidimicrobiia bacterium]